jgi:hypothetical protein
VVKILEILRGRVSASYDGVAVLRDMIECHVLLLKRWAHLLCDYVWVEDPTCESTEELEDDTIVMQMMGLVGRGVMVAVECAVVAFSASRHPNLVSRPLLCFFLCPWLALGGELLT